MRYQIGQVFETEGDIARKRYFVVVRVGQVKCTVVERHSYPFRRRVCCDDPLPDGELTYSPFKMKQRDTGLSYGTTYLVPARFDSRNPFSGAFKPTLSTVMWLIYASCLVALPLLFYAIALWYFLSSVEA